MKISKLFLTAALAAMVALAGCGKSDSSTGNNPTPDKPSSKTGISINGVRWAECNVDAVGTFAASAESPGMFYQWNSQVAWPATGDVTGWNDTNSSGNVWVTANDPCPIGWRVPTVDEQATLLDARSEWTTLNGVAGRRFTDQTSGASIFLPAAGCRYGSTGALLIAGNDGYYWSSSSDSATDSWYLYFYSASAYQYGSNRSDGFSVRCVR